MTHTIQHILDMAEQQLDQVFANQETQTRFEAELLLAYILQQPRSYLRAHPEQVLSTADAQQFNALIARCAQHEPIAYITGKQEFWSLEFIVTKDTLIPRPETELLVETVLGLLNKKNSITNEQPKNNVTHDNQNTNENSNIIRIADLGTGSGAIAIALAHEKPAWQIYATDISEKALAIAKQNAIHHHTNNIIFLQGEWCGAFDRNHLQQQGVLKASQDEVPLKFDAIISNPPYIADEEWETYAKSLAFEPKTALTSGPQGLDAIREIIQQAKNHLDPGGYLLLEHGYAQGAQVRDLMETVGYTHVRSKIDLSNHERITLGRYF